MLNSICLVLMESMRNDPRLSELEQARSLFHLVANTRYGGVGARSDERLYLDGVGSCSVKHSVLASLLEACGFEVKKYILKVHLNCLNSYLPTALAVDDESLIDFHNFLKVRINGVWLIVDATFGQFERKLGLPSNVGWCGAQNCDLLFSGDVGDSVEVADIYESKQKHVATLDSLLQKNRRDFFNVLCSYLEQGVCRAPKELG